MLGCSCLRCLWIAVKLFVKPSISSLIGLCEMSGWSFAPEHLWGGSVELPLMATRMLQTNASWAWQSSSMNKLWVIWFLGPPPLCFCIWLLTVSQMPFYRNVEGAERYQSLRGHQTYSDRKWFPNYFTLWNFVMNLVVSSISPCFSSLVKTLPVNPQGSFGSS